MNLLANTNVIVNIVQQTLNSLPNRQKRKKQPPARFCDPEQIAKKSKVEVDSSMETEVDLSKETEVDLSKEKEVNSFSRSYQQEWSNCKKR